MRWSDKNDHFQLLIERFGVVCCVSELTQWSESKSLIIIIIVIIDHHHDQRQSASLLSSLNHWRVWFFLRNTTKAFQDEIAARTLCEMRELDDRTMALAWKWKTIPISMRSSMLRNWNAFQLNDRWSIHFFSFDSMDGFGFFCCFSSEWNGRWVSKSFNTLVWLKVCQKVKKKPLQSLIDFLMFGIRNAIY